MLGSRAIIIHAAESDNGSGGGRKSAPSISSRTNGVRPPQPHRQNQANPQRSSAPALPAEFVAQQHYGGVQSPDGFGGAVSPYHFYYPAYAVPQSISPYTQQLHEGHRKQQHRKEEQQVDAQQETRVSAPPAKPIQIVDPRTGNPVVLSGLRIAAPVVPVAATVTPTADVVAVVAAASERVDSSGPVNVTLTSTPKPLLQFIDPKTGKPLTVHLQAK